MWVIQDKGGIFLNITDIKNDIKKHIGCEVYAKVYGMRNKTYIIEGYISNAYPSIFTINEGGIEKSFSYSDIATGEIIIKYM